jgi:hypothetical protein
VQHQCKFCPSKIIGYRSLKRHVEETHPQEFIKIERWLGERQVKLKTHELLASEGMLGHRERRNDG